MARKETFESLLDAVLAENASLVPVPRLQLILNDQLINEPVLNDVLIAHKNPAATSRFIIERNGLAQDIRSSGLWVAGPAGSTGGILSAGGRVTGLNDERRQIPRARTLCLPRKQEPIESDFVTADENLEIISRMREGMIYLMALT